MPGVKNPQIKVHETPTFIQIYCLECKCIVISQERIPNEVLEMSFFKLLEQFFYNEKITVSQARDQESMPGEQTNCNHSLFRDCELTFRFGKIATTIKFEKLDAYSIDMNHFGLSKGDVSEEEHLGQVRQQLQTMRKNLQETFTFFFTKIDSLFLFLGSGMEEVKRISQFEPLTGMKDKILVFLEKFKANYGAYHSFVFMEIFGEEINPDNP